MVETTSQSPPVGTRDNGEQNISIGREGCEICPRQTETAGQKGRDYTMEGGVSRTTVWKNELLQLQSVVLL